MDREVTNLNNCLGEVVDRIMAELESVIENTKQSKFSITLNSIPNIQNHHLVYSFMQQILDRLGATGEITRRGNEAGSAAEANITVGNHTIHLNIQSVAAYPVFILGSIGKEQSE